MNSLRFISRTGTRRFYKRYKINLYLLKVNFLCTSAANKDQKLLEDEDILNKIIYNEVLYKDFRKVKPNNNTPICLKYLNQEINQSDEIQSENLEAEKEIVHFPYKTKGQNDEPIESDKFSELVKNFTPSDDEKLVVPEWSSENYQISFRNIEKPFRWAYEDIKVEETKNMDDTLKFGSYNPDSKVSSIPCGGCGALLHCNDPKIPGFIPAELFENKINTQLLGEKCQRCHFLTKFNVALGLNVSPSEYKSLISKIKDKEGLVIIMIDILDFPCSVFPKIFDLIGSQKPVVIVGNKVDLLIQEGPWFKKNFKNSLLWSLKKQNINLDNVKHVDLISAKTGYGVERLIDVLHSNWDNKGDIYLVGCTNVGKSSLFNTLICSDFCKVKAINLMQRATISAWPGTTLNLLKFPIMRSHEWRLMIRSKRISAQFKEESAFRKLQILRQKIHLEQIPLQEFVGTTFFNRNLDESDDLSSDTKRKGIDPNAEDFARGCWFYDTPGVVHHDQIINFLTAFELLLTVPKRMLLPRNFLMKPGSSLFIAGLARLDFINGPNSVWFTVFASMELPITITKTKDADSVYEKLLGTPYFRVPVDGKERLAKWPKLLSKKFEIEGKLSTFFTRHHNLNEGDERHLKDSDVDIVLSSAGWVAVTVPISYRCIVEAWTLQGRGIYVRDIPLIKKGYTFKGSKIPGTPAFKTVMKEVKGYSFNDPPL